MLYDFDIPTRKPAKQSMWWLVMTSDDAMKFWSKAIQNGVLKHSKMCDVQTK